MEKKRRWARRLTGGGTWAGRRSRHEAGRAWGVMDRQAEQAWDWGRRVAGRRRQAATFPTFLPPTAPRHAYLSGMPFLHQSKWQMVPPRSEKASNVCQSILFYILSRLKHVNPFS